MQLAEFVRWAIEDGPFEGCHLDGGDVQEKAVKFGILERTKYDPAVHGESDCGADPGDEWFVFSEAFKAVLRQ